MKKWIALMLSLILVLALTACGTEQTAGEAEVKPESGEVQVDVPVPAAPMDMQEPTASTDVWGVTLSAENVTSTGLTLVCTQSGGTADGELRTGSPFWLERLGADGAWEKVSALFPDEEICWTMEAWIIPQNRSVEWQVSWEYLYGQLSAGQYRMGKEIMLFRGPGDFDEQPCYAEFEIKN